MQKEKSCGALIFHLKKSQTKPELLLIKHRNGGHWSFPKGHVEGNETETETALREISEETGLYVSLLPGFRESVSYRPKSNVEKEVIYFLAEAPHNQLHLQKEEISRGIWVDVGQALRLVTYENDRHLISRAKEYLAEKPL